MALEFIWTVFGSIFFSVASASLYWKHHQTIRGFVSVFMMMVLGTLMLLVFQWIHPNEALIIPVIKVLYNLCLIYFVLQWFWSLYYVNHLSNINTQEVLHGQTDTK